MMLRRGNRNDVVVGQERIAISLEFRPVPDVGVHDTFLVEAQVKITLKARVVSKCDAADDRDQ